nr:sulfotransferase 1C2-like [Dermacentor andersoni]
MGGGLGAGASGGGAVEGKGGHGLGLDLVNSSTQAECNVATSNKPNLLYYKGVPLAGFLPQECIESACEYKPTKDDLYIATYVKCGTTWTQHVVYLIQTGGVPPSNAEEFYRASPYIEAFGAECVLWMKKPGALKTHLPVQLLEYSPEAKYLVVARNPRDVIVSLQYHWLAFVGYHYNGTFDDAFEHFMNDEIDCGNFFTFYKDWYERSREPNVLFVVYEDLKRNPEETILRIARFMGAEYEANLLKDDRKRLCDVVKYSSVDEMKKYTNGIIQDFFRGSFKFQGPEYEGFRQFHRGIHSAGVEAANKVKYVRKGIVGDWKNHFSQEQLKRLNEKFQRETEGSDIANLWPDMNFLE